MRTHGNLIESIDSTAVGPGSLAFWWLGQHSFVLKLGSAVLYLDPYLTADASRQVPPLLDPEEVRHASLILGTHDHGDHIDRPVWPALALASPHARFVVPELVRERLARELGIPVDRFIGLDDGESAVVEGVRITGVAAAHEFLDQDRATGRYPYLGYAISGNGCAAYHAGDCCIYEGLQRKLLERDYDVVFLPINGRDATRLAANCIGHLPYQEAADLAGVLRPRLTIPAHFEMFAMNSEDPALFVDYMGIKYPSLAVHVPVHGARFVLEPDLGD